MFKRLLFRGLNWFRRKYFPTAKDKILERFDKENGQLKIFKHESLDNHSLILDIGGYLGDYAAEMFARYNCQIKIFEPMPVFAQTVKERFIKNDRIEVFDFGLGGETKIENITVDGDASSLHRTKKNKETIQIKTVDIIEWIDKYSIESISLASINIEGGEYPLLERLLECGYVNKFDNLQIQFHDNYQKNAESMMRKIQERLSKTHELTYQYRFVWENWKKKI